MTAPVAAQRPRTLKFDSIDGGKKNAISQSQTRRSELAEAVNTVLYGGDDQLDNRQKLNQLNTLLANTSGDELNTLVDALPDNAIKQWISEIQNNDVPNNGLTADQRHEFFSLLGQQLTSAQADRWHSALPESLQEDFSTVVSKYSRDDQNQIGINGYSSGSEQDSLFLMGNSIQARSRQAAVSQESAARTSLTENVRGEQQDAKIAYSPTENIDATLKYWEGAESADTITRAIKALNPDGTDHQNKQLVYQYLELQRSIQNYANDPETESNVLANLIQTHKLLADAGLASASALPSNLQFRFTSGSLPSELSYRKSRETSDDIKFGEPGWYNRVSIGAFPPSLLIKYAIEQVASLTYAASHSHLSQLNQFDGHNITHSADIQAMMDSAQPKPARANTADEPMLGDLLQRFDTDSAAPNSKEQYWQLADTSYQLASSLLTDSAGGMSEAQITTLARWINANSLEDLGFETTKVVREEHNDGEYTVRLGRYGNFGETKYHFTEAWLGSSLDDRLEYLGIDQQRWAQAQTYIGAATIADAQGRDIKRAEFSLDDAVKLVIAGVGTYVTGGVATNAVAGLFASGGALAGSVSTATAGYLSTAAGAAAGSFSSTLIVTDGDVEESLKSGLMGALTGGITEYAGSLKGATKVVAEAIVSGVQSELSGQSFQDGVYQSVVDNFSAGVASRLKAHMPEFIAGFAGKVTEVAIRTGGNPKLMQKELEQYIINFATGQASSKLTSTMGDDYAFLANSLGELATVVINSRGDMGKVRDYLDSDQFYAKLGNNLGNQITASFGGKEKFSAVLYGKITNIAIASRGNPETIANNIDSLALSIAGEWAGNKLSKQLGGVLGNEEGGLAEALGSLTNVAISSGWDTNAINTYMHGPLIAALGSEGAGIIPERFGSTGEFLGRALEHLTHSYSANNGDMNAVAENMAQFLVDEAIDFGDQVEANKSLSMGDFGGRVEHAQTQLRNYGYLDNVTGTFDIATADALSSFQQDQLGHLNTALRAENNITLRRAFNDQISALEMERNAGEIDAITRLLLDKPYTSATGVTESDGATAKPSEELTSNWENAPLVDLGMGSKGPGVARLQHLLTDLGYDPGTIDGIFGEDTAASLNKFQQDQLELVQNKIGEVSSANQRELFSALGSLGSALVVEQGSGRIGELTATMLKDPLTAEMLNDANLNIEVGTDGLIKVGSIANWIWGRANPSLEELVDVLGVKSPEEITEIIDNVDLDDIKIWATRIREIEGKNRNKLYKLLTENLDNERLTHFYDNLSFKGQGELVAVLKNLSDGRLEAKLDVARGMNIAVDETPKADINLPSEQDVIDALAELRTYPEFQELEAQSPDGKLTLEFSEGKTKYEDGTIYINLDYFNYAYKTEDMPEEYMRGYDQKNSPDEWQERFDSYPDYAQYSVHRILFHEAFHGTEPPASISYELAKGPQEKPAIKATNVFMSKYFDDIGRAELHNENIDLRHDRNDYPTILLR